MGDEQATGLHEHLTEIGLWLDAVQTSVVLLDGNLTVTWANRRALDTGLSAENLIGRSLVDWLHDRSDAERIRAADGASVDVDVAIGDRRSTVTVSRAPAGASMAAYIASWNLDDEVRASLEGIGEQSADLNGAAAELATLAERMEHNAGDTATQASLLSALSSLISEHVEAVSRGASEMSSSITAIADNASTATQVATEAVDSATTTSRTVERLGESSAEIGKVIEFITGIAQQTNLLALNATIEAARAGEAGRGFAVVANEVKELAKETAAATEGITELIETIQTDTAQAVDAMGEISAVIARIADIQTLIASAVEEQDITTSEIARSVSQAQKGAGDISDIIDQVANAARGTSSGASDTQASAARLSAMASQLQELVSRLTS